MVDEALYRFDEVERVQREEGVSRAVDAVVAASL